ncbi:MAG: hypothetical protein AAGC76_09360 [Luteibacter sp.]|uniref:hypothetical protein n=1 Tax=Luteibacter sp. TaxID=1886636 RepID=UPI0028091085|nr:hypothetical protein [Luteibacter sp.]MDQ7996049.1 hypothetical protein [Luteibacter sp.]
MRNARVQLFGLTAKYATVDLDANQGSTVGKDLKWPDGSVVTEADIRSGGTTTSQSSSVTDQIDEGRYNLYFTDERAQAAVRPLFNRIDAGGDIRVDAEGNLRITY